MAEALIVGGGSDIAQHLEQRLSFAYKVSKVSRAALDVSNEEAVKEAMNIAYDLVINCAGVLNSGEVVGGEASDWVSGINTNVLGAYYVCKYALERHANTKLVMISSTAAFNAYPDWSSYCIGKMAQVKITFALLDRGYRVACYCPGAIDTKFRANVEIVNSNIMSVEEACTPIVSNCLSRQFSAGVFFYRRPDQIKEMLNERV